MRFSKGCCRFSDVNVCEMWHYAVNVCGILSGSFILVCERIISPNQRRGSQTTCLCPNWCYDEGFKQLRRCGHCHYQYRLAQNDYIHETIFGNSFWITLHYRLHYKIIGE